MPDFRGSPPELKILPKEFAALIAAQRKPSPLASFWPYAPLFALPIGLAALMYTSGKPLNIPKPPMIDWSLVPGGTMLEKVQNYYAAKQMQMSEPDLPLFRFSAKIDKGVKWLLFMMRQLPTKENVAGAAATLRGVKGGKISPSLIRSMVHQNQMSRAKPLWTLGRRLKRGQLWMSPGGTLTQIT